MLGKRKREKKTLVKRRFIAPRPAWLGEPAKFEPKEETKYGPTKPDPVQTGIFVTLKDGKKNKWCMQSATVSVRDLDKEDEYELTKVLKETDSVRD